MAINLLIDGRNTAYRAVFAAKNDIQTGKINAFAIWMRFMHKWVINFKPSSVHVCWDCKTLNVWRKAIYEDYKGNRKKLRNDSSFDALSYINVIEKIASKVLPQLPIKQHKKESQEADDLIYALCQCLPNDNIVVSSDKDLTQLAWQLNNTKIYNPVKNKFHDKPKHNPVIIKALAGDKSDNINGYKGIGEIKARKLMANKDLFQSFLIENGGDILKRNLLLIDMQKNPSLEENIDYVKDVNRQKLLFDAAKAKQYIMEEKVAGFMGEFHDLITPFGCLID